MQGNHLLSIIIISKKGIFVKLNMLINFTFYL
nr:MAG TPA: hypothetical protein [Caudoviricetes sp.]